MNFHVISIEYWTILPRLSRAELRVFSQVLLKRDSVIFSFSLVFVFQMFSQSSHMIYSGSLDLHIHIASKPENKIHWMDIENKPLTSHSALKGLTKQCKNLRSLINPLKPVKTHIRPNCLKNWYFLKRWLWFSKIS